MISNMTIQKIDVEDLPQVFEKLNTKRYGTDIDEDICKYSIPDRVIYYYNNDTLCLELTTADSPEKKDGHRKLAVGPEGLLLAICPSTGSFQQTLDEASTYLINALRTEYPDNYFNLDRREKKHILIDGHTLPMVYLQNEGIFTLDYVYDMTGEEICGDSEQFSIFCLNTMKDYLIIV